MNAGKTIFSQLMDCLPWSTFVGELHCEAADRIARHRIGHDVERRRCRGGEVVGTRRVVGEEEREAPGPAVGDAGHIVAGHNRPGRREPAPGPHRPAEQCGLQEGGRGQLRRVCASRRGRGRGCAGEGRTALGRLGGCAGLRTFPLVAIAGAALSKSRRRCLHRTPRARPTSSTASLQARVSSAAATSSPAGDPASWPTNKLAKVAAT